MVSAFLLFAATAQAAPPVFSLSGDWSNSRNPNGAWSFNLNSSPISTFQTFWWGQAGWGYSWIADGVILRSDSSSAGMTDPWGDVIPPMHDWQPGDINLTALSIPYGGDTTFLNVTWTSPATGTIDILGRAWDSQIYADRDMRWALSVGGEIYAQRASVRGLYRTNSEAQFASNLVGGHTLTGISVTQGEVIEFRLATQTYYGQYLGLDITIVPAPPFIPNPLLSIAPMSFLSFSNLTPGAAYQLQRSVEWYWSNQPGGFTATNAFFTQIVAGVSSGGDYRLALSPAPVQAFATPQVVKGFVVDATVTSGGSGYFTIPAVTIVGGGGSNATAVAQVSGGAVTNLSITSAGIGYTNPPTIIIAPPLAAAVLPTTVLPMMRVDAYGLAPSNNYQLQFKPDLAGAWGNWNGGLFSPADVRNSQYLFITNRAGFFRLQYVP